MFQQVIVSSLLVSLLWLPAGCARLDANLFDNDNTIDQYYFDNYSGEVHFVLDASYDLTEPVTLFQLNSKDPDGNRKKIWAVYIGDTTNISTPTQKIIVYNHGNYLHMDYYWQRAKLLANAGGKHHFGVLMVDYQGYGLSEGEPSEKALYNDVEAGINWLISQGMALDSQLVMYGYSLGTAPSTELTANPRTTVKPSRLILEAPFASADVMVQDSSLLALPGSYVTNNKIDNANKIKKVSQPFLWLHGIQDSFLSIKTHGEIVYKNHPGPTKQAVRVEGADHGSIPTTMGLTNYINTVATFIDS